MKKIKWLQDVYLTLQSKEDELFLERFAGGSYTGIEAVEIGCSGYYRNIHMSGGLTAYGVPSDWFSVDIA
jgi:hypothetical protein